MQFILNPCTYHKMIDTTPLGSNFCFGLFFYKYVTPLGSIINSNKAKAYNGLNNILIRPLRNFNLKTDILPTVCGSYLIGRIPMQPIQTPAGSYLYRRKNMQYNPTPAGSNSDVGVWQLIKFVYSLREMVLISTNLYKKK